MVLHEKSMRFLCPREAGCRVITGLLSRNKVSGKNEVPVKQILLDTLGSYVNMNEVLVRQDCEEV